MANQSISADANHDDKTGRSAGEDFTLTGGATLTIDSCPHLTAMGILGDITLTEGTLRIDGSRTFEVTYSGGSGSLPAVGAAISWNSGADTGKIVRLNSGNNVSGVLTLTKAVGKTTPDSADSITDGSWSADLDAVKVGFLIVFGEDQDWGSVDATSSLVITGDWYEIGVGDGTDDQTLELPHTGHQNAIWVETGEGTNEFEIWHRIVPQAGTVYWNGISQFGATFESGYVFEQAFGDATVTFGDATNGGVPPDGARIRIPNVHLGTTSVAAPTTEVNSATFGAHIGIISPNTNLNVSIDHLNASSVYVDFRGTNAVTMSHSAIGLYTTAAFINKVNAAVVISDCFIGCGSLDITGGSYGTAPALTITDNIGGVTFDDCVMYSGVNGTSGSVLALTTMANIAFTGINKLVMNQQDENTVSTIRGSVAVNLTAETIISLGGPIIAIAGCANWTIDELVFGLPPGRGTTEQNMNDCLSLTGTQGFLIKSGHKADGAKVGTLGLFVLVDAFDTTIRNFGAVDAKISLESRGTYVASLSGITLNTKLKRLWFNTMNGAMGFPMLNSVADVLIENCCTEYDDEIEIDANRVLVKGLHSASGSPNTSTGVEGDNTNVLSTCFLDYFKSDTTGALGLQFNDRGQTHLADIEVVSGTPVWNGLCDLLMRTSGDQVIYTWPYEIKGHTGFQNAAVQLAGTNTSSIDVDYSLDKGSGWEDWDSATGAHLSAEEISPAGFRFRIRLTCNTSGSTNALNGLAVLTTTTIADQKANLYPLEVVTVRVTALDAVTGLPVSNARVFLEAGTGGPLAAGTDLFNALTDANGVVEQTDFGYEGDQPIIGRVRRGSSYPYYKTSPISGTISSNGFETTAFLVTDV